jgi:DHA2 family methylenomycin A resistance protein-like MFS transporter
LGTDITGLQWIGITCVVLFAIVLLSSGAQGDVLGARRVYVLSSTLFTAASLTSDCAPTMSTLIAGQIMQGIGASLLVPCSLLLLTHAYPDSIDRAKAIASWPSRGGRARRGQLADGVLIIMFDWRSTVLVKVPSASRGSG